jgi:hypothetical protein
MPIVYNDGSVPFGTGTTTINGTTYYINSCQGSKPTNVVDVPDEVGSPRKQVIVASKCQGTMTLQLETTNSVVPSPGTLCTIPAGMAGTGSAITASITDVATPRDVNSAWVVDVGWVQKLN